MNPKPKPKGNNKSHWLEVFFKTLDRNLKVTELIKINKWLKKLFS